MRSVINAFDSREGGRFDVSLVYEDGPYGHGGKIMDAPDAFRGRIFELVLVERNTRVVAFESDR